MEVLLLLIPLSVALAAGFTLACLRAIGQGQFDDLESPRWRMLFDSPVKQGEMEASATRPERKTRSTRKRRSEAK
jgi:cbb3-type cytochrome oxidase maturation protein